MKKLISRLKIDWKTLKNWKNWKKTILSQISNFGGPKNLTQVLRKPIPCMSRFFESSVKRLGTFFWKVTICKTCHSAILIYIGGCQVEKVRESGTDWKKQLENVFFNWFGRFWKNTRPKPFKVPFPDTDAAKFRHLFNRIFLYPQNQSKWSFHLGRDIDWVNLARNRQSPCGNALELSLRSPETCFGHFLSGRFGVVSQLKKHVFSIEKQVWIWERN